MTTYNWPWEKNGCCNEIPIFCNVCPCAVLEVMGKAGLRGNYLRFMWKRKTFSDGMRGILGMNILFPACGPHAMVASMTCWCRCWMMYLVPWQWSFVGSRFRKSMLFFSRSVCEVPYRRGTVNWWTQWDTGAHSLLFSSPGKKPPHNYVIYFLYFCIRWTYDAARRKPFRICTKAWIVEDKKLSKFCSLLTVISSGSGNAKFPISLHTFCCSSHTLSQKTHITQHAQVVDIYLFEKYNKSNCHSLAQMHSHI